ncbi:hypothetical protein BLOT_004557 [Blomia tropicalis]|nr:hypothetical protein BLOT_004557 [Blomia tropicalis]
MFVVDGCYDAINHIEKKKLYPLTIAIAIGMRKESKYDVHRSKIVSNINNDEHSTVNDNV